MKKSNTVAVVGAKKLKMWKQSWKTRGHEEGHNKGQWEMRMGEETSGNTSEVN